MCHKPFGNSSAAGAHDFNAETKRFKVCSLLCSQSLQYSLGLAHGVLLLHVLVKLYGMVSSTNLNQESLPDFVLPAGSEEGADSISICRQRKENDVEPSNTALKREPQDLSHPGGDAMCLKVFFDPEECSDREPLVPDKHARSSSLPASPGAGMAKPTQIPMTVGSALNNCTTRQFCTERSLGITRTGSPLNRVHCRFCHHTVLSGELQALAKHYCDMHTQEINLICEICGVPFSERKLLRQHKKNNHGEKENKNNTKTKVFLGDEYSEFFPIHKHLQVHRKINHSMLKQASDDNDTCGDTQQNQITESKTVLKREKDGEKRHRCCHCNKEYPTKVRLQRHYQFVHSRQTAADCSVCGKSFRNKLLLKHHIQFMHSEQTPGDCQVCGKTYRNTHLLKMHMKVVHKVKVMCEDSQEVTLQCVFCSHTFPAGSNNAIANHLVELHSKEISPSCNFRCELCGVLFKRKVYLTRHMNKIHCFDAAGFSKVEQHSNKETNKKRYPCDKCGKTYSHSALSKHIRIYHTTQEPVECDVCGKTLINSFHLDQHKRQHVPSKICHICGAKFKTDAGLRGHLAAHKGTKSHVCEVCGVGFVRKTSWQRHIKLHSGTVPLHCEYCPKTFKTVYSLNTHMLSKHHRGVFFNNRLKTLEEVGYVVDKASIERHLNHQCATCSQPMENGTCPAHPDTCALQFKCNYCELVLSHVDALCQHLKKHNIPLAFTASTRNFTTLWSAKRDDSDVEFTCQVCHKSFQRRENLAGHMKQHKEKAFACPVCFKKFTYKCNMKNHLRTHSEDKPFQCEVCQKSFKCKQLLNNHRLVHNLSQSPFKCQICGKGLTRKFFLQRHYRQMHPGVIL